MKYYIKPFKKMLDFTGKSTNKEFWLFFLFHVIISGIIGFLRGLTGIEYLNEIYFICTLLPFIALGFRRLNDAGYNKWLFLIPFLNIVLACLPKKES